VIGSSGDEGRSAFISRIGDEEDALDESMDIMGDIDSTTNDNGNAQAGTANR
jgi:hypothetical protein